LLPSDKAIRPPGKRCFLLPEVMDTFVGGNSWNEIHLSATALLIQHFFLLVMLTWYQKIFPWRLSFGD